MLFLCTEAYQVAVVAFDAATGDLVTLSKGDLASRVGQPSDTGILGALALPLFFFWRALYLRSLVG